MQEQMKGLLAAAPQGQGAPSAMTGLLAGAQQEPAQAPVDPQMKAQWSQMAQSLAQNPTPEAVQQIIAQLQKMGDEGSAKFAQILAQGLEKPEAIPALAGMIVEKLGAQ